MNKTKIYIFSALFVALLIVLGLMFWPESKTADEAQAQKQLASILPVKTRPIVYTSSGHSKKSAIKQGDSISTSCTTDANTACYIELSKGEDMVRFDSMQTDGQGVAVWHWTASENIPPGSWNVQAYAGDKESRIEVIYIQ